MFGHQEITLRCNCNCGPIGLTKPLHNDGKFKLFYSIEAFIETKPLRTICKHRSVYTSPIQNKIVKLSGNSVQGTAIRRIKNKGPGYFSVLADEMQDISKESYVHYLQYL